MRYADRFGMGLSTRVAVGPGLEVHIPTEICKLLVDPLESHVGRSMRIQRCGVIWRG